MKFEVLVMVVMPCSDVVEHRRFGGSFCLHLNGVTTQITKKRM